MWKIVQGRTGTNQWCVSWYLLLGLGTWGWYLIPDTRYLIHGTWPLTADILFIGFLRNRPIACNRFNGSWSNTVSIGRPSCSPECIWRPDPHVDFHSIDLSVVQVSATWFPCFRICAIVCTMCSMMCTHGSDLYIRCTHTVPMYIRSVLRFVSRICAKCFTVRPPEGSFWGHFGGPGLTYDAYIRCNIR